MVKILRSVRVRAYPAARQRQAAKLQQQCPGTTGHRRRSAELRFGMVPLGMPVRADSEIGCAFHEVEFSRLEPLNRSSRRESALTCFVKMERTYVHCYEVHGEFRPPILGAHRGHEPGNSSSERWRLAGEFCFRFPTGRRDANVPRRLMEMIFKLKNASARGTFPPCNPFLPGRCMWCATTLTPTRSFPRSI
jgi:hypothetical protein